MWRFSWRVLYVVILGCLPALGCRPVSGGEAPAAASPRGITIGHINCIGYPGDCGCALQRCEDMERNPYRCVFVSSYNKHQARMNLNGYDVELREYYNRRQDNLRDDGYYSTRYFVIRVRDRRGIDWPSPGGCCPDKEPRDNERYEERERQTNQRYEERDTRSDRDRNLQYEQQTQRGGISGGYTPGITFLRQYDSREERYEERNEDRNYDPNRDSRYPDRDHPWYEFRDVDVQVEYFLMGPCPRWEDGRCIMDFVDAKITVYKNGRKQTEMKTTGTCGCI